MSIWGNELGCSGDSGVHMAPGPGTSGEVDELTIQLQSGKECTGSSVINLVTSSSDAR